MTDSENIFDWLRDNRTRWDALHRMRQHIKAAYESVRNPPPEITAKLAEADAELGAMMLDLEQERAARHTGERPWVAGDRIWRGWEDYTLLILDVDGDDVTIIPPQGYTGLRHDSQAQLRDLGWKLYTPEESTR